MWSPRRGYAVLVDTVIPEPPEPSIIVLFLKDTRVSRCSACLVHRLELNGENRRCPSRRHRPSSLVGNAGSWPTISQNLSLGAPIAEPWDGGRLSAHSAPPGLYRLGFVAQWMQPTASRTESHFPAHRLSNGVLVLLRVRRGFIGYHFSPRRHGRKACSYSYGCCASSAVHSRSYT